MKGEFCLPITILLLFGWLKCIWRFSRWWFKAQRAIEERDAAKHENRLHETVNPFEYY
jgi:hypothetical protein